MAAAGHHVVYGVRAPGAPDTASVADAVAPADVVVLAVPGTAAKEVLAPLGTARVGKFVNQLGHERDSGRAQP